MDRIRRYGKAGWLRGVNILVGDMGDIETYFTTGFNDEIKR
jgi:hypothetical protein